MFRQILTGAQQTVLELLSRIPEVRTFYLAGGTGLALQLGHRRSEDFDFFRAPALVPQDFLAVLREAGDLIKYRGVTVDPYHLLRRLTFFEDAEAETMPHLLIDLTWDEIKTFFRAETARLFRDL